MSRFLESVPSDDINKKVKRIEITTRKVVNDVMSGQYRSHFKGHGVQFSEHRLYMPGDDVRHIDWKVSARTREPLIKIYDEERELTVFLVVDVSGSEWFGTSRKLKSEVAAEIGGMLAYAASYTGDRVGALLFADKVELIIPPKKGRQHVLRIVRDLLSFQPETKGTDLAGALRAAAHLMKHSGVVFVLSDFLAEDYEMPLKRLARRNDVVAIQLIDEREREIPDIGLLQITDPETGKHTVINSGSYAFKAWFERFRKDFENQTNSALKGGKTELLQIFTKEDYVAAVVRFFRSRRHRH